MKLNQVVNRLSQTQTQLKFSITDGRYDTKHLLLHIMKSTLYNITQNNKHVHLLFKCSSHVNVTLWDSTAKRVYEDLQKPLEEPVIIILAAAKVGKWKG